MLLSKTDVTQYTTIGNVALTITNFGMIGNGFRVYDDEGNPLPSFEYPIGSGTEHLYRAGLWVGAVTTAGDTLVTTGVCDATSASAGSEGFEFYPTVLESDTVIEKSMLLTSYYYDPDAVSEQDFEATYYDYTSPSLIPGHNPLYLRVSQKSYAWSYPYADDFVIISFTIYNEGEGVLSQLYMGIYAELVTGNRRFWGDQFARTPFYQHKRLYFIDSLRMVWERNDGFDTVATQVAGIKIIGVEINGERLSPDSFDINFHWWSWLDMVGSVNDIDRYILLSDTTRDPDVDDQYVAAHGYPDPISLLSIGPFDYLTNSDSITLTVAFVGGENLQNLIENAEWAQKAYDSYYIIPGPPPSPLLEVVPGNQMVTLYWDKSPESSKDPSTGKEDFEGYRIYRRVYPDTNWTLLAQFDVVDSLFYNTGLPDTMTTGSFKGWRYYVDKNLRNGFVYEYSVTSFDQGDPELDLPSLESSIRMNAVTVTPGTPPTSREDLKVGVYPNPYRVSSLFDQPGVWGRVLRFYNLPERATIYIYNLAGDLVKTIEHNDPVTGEATWNLITDKEQPVATGLYIFVVKDHKTGRVKRGKFLIIK
jgi:hypothetical protein